tara:strand:- start:1288 stop:1410 length:123 start_codon:yes stop_codon:yes gene_type:complete
MDGNGPYVWSCLAILVLILALNLVSALRRKKKIIKSLKEI